MSGKGKKRSPVAGAAPSQRRRPVAGAAIDQRRSPAPGAPLNDDPTIVWGFGLLDMDGPWGWGDLTAEKAVEVLAKLQQWERQKAGEFFGGGGRRGNKRIPLDNLCDAARGRLQELQLDDLDALWELHQSGKERIWGARLGHVFYVLWWDPQHTVCPSKKR